MKGIRFYGLIDKVKDKIMLACIFGISFKTEPETKTKFYDLVL